jgi:putative transposase
VAQSFAQIYLHLIFSTKKRQPFLADRELRLRLHSYMAGICQNIGTTALIIGGVADHVHILTRFSRTHSVAQVLRELKRESSKWLKENNKDLGDFAWQDGYGAFSVSPAHVEPLKMYIAEQEKHHSTESFQDEYRRVLSKNGLEYDERYIWD